MHPNKLYIYAFLSSTTLFIPPHHPGSHPTLVVTHTHISACFLSKKENLIHSYSKERERDEEPPQASSYPFLILKEQQQGGAATPLRSLH